MNPQVGHIIESELLLSEEEIITGATSVGDGNPIHSSANHNNKRVNGIIASGSHISAVFSALIPTELSKFGAVLGLEMSFRFRAPIIPDQKYIMRWQVSANERTQKLDGYLLTLHGDITGSDSEAALTGEAKLLLLD